MAMRFAIAAGVRIVDRDRFRLGRGHGFDGDARRHRQPGPSRRRRALLTVRTAPGATCQGSRQGHFSNDYTIVLPPVTAASDGTASWRWRVLSGRHPIGARGVRVTCAAGDRSGMLATQFSVE